MFTVNAVTELPSAMLIGVVSIASAVRFLCAIPVVGRRMPAALAAHPLPLLGDYVRLVRSLTIARAFEDWPADLSITDDRSLVDS